MVCNNREHLRQRCVIAFWASSSIGALSRSFLMAFTNRWITSVNWPMALFFWFEVIFAALFLILLGARSFYMTRTQSSAVPENTHALQKLGAKVVHYGMYVSMGLIAASGLIIGALYTLFGPEGVLISLAVFIHETSVTPAIG